MKPAKQFDDTNRGVLFNNTEDKRDGKKDPDYRGNVNIDGTDYWLAGWINVARKSGRKYLSLKVTPKTVVARRAASNGAAAELSLGDELNDEIPF